MKRFRWILPLFLYVLWTSLTAAQVVTTLTDADWKRLPAHPRLFVNEQGLSAISNRTDTVSLRMKALLIYQAEEALLADKIVYPSTGFKFSAVRTAQGRILPLALAYRLTSDTRYLDGARQELLALARLPDWCPGHFLDVGEAAAVAGIGFDWLYDALSPADRTTISDAIVKNALNPSLLVKDQAGSWVKGDFNWTQVCHGGLTIGALAIAERMPALSRQVTDRAISSIPYVGASYAPDGTYAEGPGYWSYGTSYHVLMADALRTVFGTTCGLEKFPGFLQTTDFMTQMTGPAGIHYNYADSHPERDGSEPVMLWFARMRNKRSVAAEELSNIVEQYKLLEGNKTLKTRIPLSRHFALGVIWWNPSLPEPAVDLPPLHWTAAGKVSLGVLRSAWNDPNAVYVALKGGTPDGSHAHMDIGSFILEANGVRWAIDPGAESYDKMRAAKLDLWNYTQNSSRWTTFRTGPEGHNILRFDNERQDVDGLVVIRKLDSTGTYTGNVADLLSLYKKKVSKVSRKILLSKDRSVLITDEWTAGAGAVSASWQWLTYAEVTATEKGFLLRQAGQSLELQVECTAEKRMTVEDVSEPANLQDSPNPGLKRIVIRVPTAAHSTAQLRVKAVPSPVASLAALYKKNRYTGACLPEGKHPIRYPELIALRQYHP